MLYVLGALVVDVFCCDAVVHNSSYRGRRVSDDPVRSHRHTETGAIARFHRRVVRSATLQGHVVQEYI